MWSRVAQVQSSCHCRVCLNTANTLIRRSTTAASRRKVTASDLFTACYTTILGTATIIDASRKDARRKELDEKLEKAKASLSSQEIQEDPLNEQYQEDYGSSDPTENRDRNRRTRKKRAEKVTSSLLQELASLCDITRQTPSRPTWLQNQIDWVKIEANIVAEEDDPNSFLREPKSDEQLDMTTNTVIRLVNRLLGQSQIRRTVSGRSEEEASKELTEVEENILRELEVIRRGLHYPSYEQPALDPIGSRSARSLLSSSIRSIFNRASSSTEAVGTICYNLLTSNFPPTIHTYNALIAGFNRIQRPDLAQIIIDSYMHDIAWPATQQTMVCFLNHYRLKDEIRGLRHIILRMRGVKKSGLHFCIVSKDKIYSWDWLEWASKRCASRRYAFVERAHRGSDIFDGIIRGWLHHGNVTSASMIFVACIRDGSWIPVQTFHQLLRACLAAIDHSAARQIIRGIVKNFRNFAAFFDRTFRQSTAAMSLKLVDSLSNLIRICGLPLHDAYSIIDGAHTSSLTRLKHVLSTVKIQLELNASIRLCSKVLETIESDRSLVSRLESAVKIVNAHQWDRAAWEGYEIISRLLSIDKRAQDLETKGRVLATQVRALIIKIRTGLDLNTDLVLSSKLHQSQHQQEYFLALSHALEHVDLHGDLMTADDIKAQLVKCIPNPHFARRLRLAGQTENMCYRVLISFYTPGAVTYPRPDNSQYRRRIFELEKRVADLEDFIKITLFSYLNNQRQKRLRMLYPNWFAMPLEPLVDYHTRRTIRGRKAQPEEIVDAQQEDVSTKSARAVGETSTESSAPLSAVGFNKIDRQLDVARPVAITCFSNSHMQTEDSMSRFIAMG